MPEVKNPETVDPIFLGMFMRAQNGLVAAQAVVQNVQKEIALAHGLQDGDGFDLYTGKITRAGGPQAGAPSESGTEGTTPPPGA